MHSEEMIRQRRDNLLDKWVEYYPESSAGKRTEFALKHQIKILDWVLQENSFKTKE